MLERRPGVGAEMSGAPRPTDGIGARPASAMAGEGAGVGTACGLGWATGAAEGCTTCGRGASAVAPPPVTLERLPNTILYSELNSVLRTNVGFASCRPLHQLVEQRTQQARPVLLGLDPAG